MSIGNVPNVRVLLLQADGSLMEGCCCVTCEANCCCNSDVEAWFQKSLKVTISQVNEADPDSPVEKSLQCLIGEWALPYKDAGLGSIKCFWENTFNPTPFEDGLAFKIEASIPKSVDAETSESLPTSCLSITITILSCKDCNGEVMNQTPNIIFENSSSNCSYSFSPNGDPISNCGCGLGSMNKLVDGSWSASFAGYSYSLLSADQLRGYFGQCWYHPEAQTRTAQLVISGAKITDVSNTDVTGSFTSSINSLNVTVDYEKKFGIPATACEYVPITPPSGFSYNLTPATSIDFQEGCGWIATIANPYTDVSNIAVTGASSYTSYYTTHGFIPGCKGDAAVWVTLGEFVHTGVTYFVKVKMEIQTSGPSSCDFRLGLFTPTPECSFNTSLNHCAVAAETCGAVINTYTLYDVGLPTAETVPSDPSNVEGPDYPDPYESSNPGISDNGTFSDVSDNCTCPAEMTRACSAYDMGFTLPPVIKADDYAPAGARYEVIVRVTNEDGSPIDYHFVYTKSLGSEEGTPSNYPKGLWTLDWNVPAEILSNSWCGCGSYVDGILRSAREKIQVLAGDVVPETLFGLGIAGVTGVDGGPFAYRSVTVYELSEFGMDPCCDCSLNICKDRHCNNCSCDGESVDNPEDAPGPCSRNLRQPVSSNYCCPCAAIKQGLVVYHDEASGNCSGEGTWLHVYEGTWVCDADDTSSLNPPYTASDNTNGTYETVWDCGGKCAYSWTSVRYEPEGCGGNAALFTDPPEPDCATYDCGSQRWIPPLYNYVDFTLTGESNLTSCTGSRTATTTSSTTPASLTTTQTFGTITGCSANGRGSVTLSPVGDCTSSSYSYNCTASAASGAWRYRNILPRDEAVAVMGSYSPEALFYYFPGNGDMSCTELTGTFEMYEMGDDWTTDEGSSRPVYLYTTFTFSVSSPSKCGGSTEPMGLIDVVCPVDVGILVDVSMNGSVTEQYDADCLAPDCTSPFYTP